ncbi:MULTISPECIES: GntR family transcriptional regulator [unclassified Pseudomonas]|uniref:GntR family transcriptional regulator n=1 Tax=unclassified Pseudomonas TaxID=196821 RepID=UPI002E817E46|nr:MULTISPECIES: GntR family transcriptional regulator [unclassified Pseudomonas]
MTSPQKQHLLAALEIRELILRGQLAPGQRVTEAGLAELLGVSRTPVRQALPTLAQEGYLISVGSRGYAVKTFTIEESAYALTARAALEGLAAATCAEKGLSAEHTTAFQACLDEGDALLASGYPEDELEQAYGEMNQRFHDLLIEASGQRILEELIARCSAVPFVSPQLMTFKETQVKIIRDDMAYAHRQHHSIFEAISRREVMRAEMLLREHAAVQRHSMSM